MPALLQPGAVSLLESETKRVGGTTKGHKRVKAGDGKVRKVGKTEAKSQASGWRKTWQRGQATHEAA